MLNHTGYCPSDINQLESKSLNKSVKKDEYVVFVVSAKTLTWQHLQYNINILLACSQANLARAEHDHPANS